MTIENSLLDTKPLLTSFILSILNPIQKSILRQLEVKIAQLTHLIMKNQKINGQILSFYQLTENFTPFNQFLSADKVEFKNLLNPYFQ
jgi:hypothetical protein